VLQANIGRKGKRVNGGGIAVYSGALTTIRKPPVTSKTAHTKPNRPVKTPRVAVLVAVK
jgi:hypothetical protein